MLLAAEELLLFLLDEQNGTLLPMTERTEHLVLAGAVLMDLQLANRIDTDLDNLTPSNPAPLGDDVLDPTLAEIAGAEETHDALYWVERTARRGHEIRERAIARLVSRGILREPGDDTFLSPDAGGGARAALSIDERSGARARQASHHAGPVQRRHPGPRGHRDHQPRGRLRRPGESSSRQRSSPGRESASSSSAAWT